MKTTNLSILCLLFAGAQVMAQQMTFPGSSRPFNNNNNNMNGLACGNTFCSSTSRCLNGQCVSNGNMNNQIGYTCYSNAYCAANMQCIGGQCVPMNNNQGTQSCANVYCAPGTTCVSGRCVANGNANSCIAMLCPVNTQCLNGQCVPLNNNQGAQSCANVYCAPGTYCANGRCVASGNTNSCSTMFCAMNTQCINGQCVPLNNNQGSQSCMNVICTAGTICVSGRCVASSGARVCPGFCAGMCIDGACITMNTPAPFPQPMPTACTNGFCPTGSTCANGQCIPSGNTCPANEVSQACYSPCEPTCSNLNQACTANAICGTPRCRCQPNYARDGTGRCIPMSQCPTNNNNNNNGPTGNVGGCATRICPAGQRCVPQVAQCIRAPCEIPTTCVADGTMSNGGTVVNNGANGNGMGNCGFVPCPAGQRCSFQGTTPVCVSAAFSG